MPTKREPEVRKRLGLSPVAGGSVAVAPAPQVQTPAPPRRYLGQGQMPNLFGIPAPYGVERPEYPAEYEAWAKKHGRQSLRDDLLEFAASNLPVPVAGMAKLFSRVPKGMAGYDFPVVDGRTVYPNPAKVTTLSPYEERVMGLGDSRIRGLGQMVNMKRGYTMDELAQGLSTPETKQIYQDVSRAARRLLHGKTDAEREGMLYGPGSRGLKDVLRETLTAGEVRPKAQTFPRNPAAMRDKNLGVQEVFMPAVREPGAPTTSRWEGLPGKAGRRAYYEAVARYARQGYSPDQIVDALKMTPEEVNAALNAAPKPSAPKGPSALERSRAEWTQEWLGKGYSFEELADATGLPVDEIRRRAMFDPDLGLPAAPKTPANPPIPSKNPPISQASPQMPYNQGDIDNLMRIMAQPQNRLPLMSLEQEAQKLHAQGLSSHQIAVMLGLDLDTARKLTGEIPRYLPWE